MKIAKQILEESKLAKEIEVLEETADAVENAEDLSVDDVSTASVDEIADAVQAAAEEASGGEETYSDANAKQIATQLKTYASGFDSVAWAPLNVKNDLTDKLDDCLANALVAQHNHTTDGTDLLVDGLPGSGKTGIVRQWAKDRGVNLFYLNAKNDDLGAILNGFPVDTIEKDADGAEHHAVARSYSFNTALRHLNNPRTVLFLDEFNRADPKLRASLLTLINEHAVEGPGKSGYYTFENMLFTIACINPSVATDPGAMDLNDAEMSRYVDTMEWDSTTGEAIKYINFYLNKLLKELDPKDEHYGFFFVRYTKILNLAMALLTSTSPIFEFDSRDDLTDLYNDKAKMLNQRSLTDALMSHGYSKQKFLDWVDRFSKFLDKDKQMIHEILDNWVEPEVQAPPVGQAGAITAASNTSTNNASVDSDDFDSIFGTEGEETDVDLFGNNTSEAGKAAKVSAAEAQNRIKTFDFTL